MTAKKPIGFQPSTGVRRTCDECNGEGSVRVLDYREMEMTEPTKPQKKPAVLARVGRFLVGFLREHVEGLVIVACVSGLLFGAYELITHVNHNFDLGTRDAYLSGEIMVEYSNGSANKCVIQRADSNAVYSTTNPVEKIYLPNRYDDAEIAARAKLLGWDYKDSNCKRFRYTDDSKWLNYK